MQQQQWVFFCSEQGSEVRRIRRYIVLADLKILFQRMPSRKFPFLVENQIKSGLPTI